MVLPMRKRSAHYIFDIKMDPVFPMFSGALLELNDLLMHALILNKAHKQASFTYQHDAVAAPLTLII